jgi:8-oxo-dGTP pyrophosphatase MutT (NUDIX family)
MLNECPNSCETLPTDGRFLQIASRFALTHIERKLYCVRDDARDEYLRTLPRKRMAAGVLLRDDDSRIVMIETTYQENWEIPGGVVEMDESPWSAAERELEEELGLIRRRMPALVVDYAPHAPDGTPEGVLWVFDGGLLDEVECQELHGADEEVKSVSLLAIDEAAERTSESLARRLRVALKAAQTQQGNVYCYEGRPRLMIPPLVG